MAKSKLSNASLLYAILSIVIGVMLLVGGFGAAADIMKWVVLVMGIVLVVFGILALTSGAVTVGVVELVVGILMIVFAWTLVWLAFLILGILLLAAGIQGITKKGNIIVTILDIVLGIALICLSLGLNWGWNATVVNVIFYITGALMIVDGILVLIKK